MLSFLAFGTRGDVQPLAVLAAEIYERTRRPCTFVSHAQHAPFLRELFPPQQIKLALVPATPVAIPKHDPITASISLDACRGSILIMFNLFALEGYHIAQALQVKACALHPYLIPTGLPSRFKGAFRRSHPELSRDLKRRQHLVMRKEDSDAAEGLSEVMHWGCLEHWMWPLYTDRWTPLREQLGLPDLSSDATATPLLYLFSPLLVEPSSYWPRSVKVCGYVSPSSPPRAARDGNEQPVDSLMKLLRQFMAAGERPLYVGFGSMSLMGEQAAATVRRLGIAAQQAATELSLRVILHGSDCGSTRSHPNVSVFLLEGSVPHDWLFRQCLAAVHHGGSGTTHAVTKHFDQLYWGETIDHKKLGAVLHKCQYVRGDGPDGHVSVAALADRLKACIERAVTPQTRLRCACLGKKLREEGGTARTIEMIMQVMQDSEQGNLSNASAPHTPEASWHEKVASAPGLALLELPDNLEVAIVEGSKEEVAHIWSELFVEDCYRRSGLVINDGLGGRSRTCAIRLTAPNALPPPSTDEGDLRLYAFEPSSSNSAVTPSVQALGMNLSRFSSATSSHHLEPVAVSDCCGEDGQFCFFPNMPGNSCLRRYREGKQAQGDASINPSIAPRKHGLERIDVLKVDVEGSELDVLRGVEAAHWGIIKQVVAEVHNEANRVEDVKELLRSNGFEVSQLDLQLLEASRAPAQCLIYGRSVPGSILH